jgi:anti-sigma factor RsiW
MNCFEARQEFSAFWRSISAPERRAALVEHLGRCTKCDRAFRLFALGASVLHTGAPSDMAEMSHTRVPTGARRSRTARNSVRRWLPMCAALVLFVASGLAAYFSVITPVEQLTDELAAEEGITEMLVQEVPSSSNGLGG